MQTITIYSLQRNFSFDHAYLYFLSLFFFSMDHLLSPQAYVASASRYDKCRAPIFLIRSYMALGATSKKAALEKANLYATWKEAIIQPASFCYLKKSRPYVHQMCDLFLLT